MKRQARIVKATEAKMRFLIFFTTILVISAFGGANAIIADTYVNGYYRSDGTYVQGYWRSSPDGNHNNNWSTKGNINPYTGKKGTVRRTYDGNSPNYSFGQCTNCID